MSSQTLASILTAQSKKHCKFCAKEFRNEVSRQKHENELHIIKLMTCNICKRECLSKLEMRNHMKSHKLATCESCDKTYNMHNFSRHVKKCHNSNPSVVSSKTIQRKKERKGKQHECSNCFKEFAWVQSMKRHNKLCTAREVEDKEYKCPLCRKSYSWEKSLTKHLKVVH